MAAVGDVSCSTSLGQTSTFGLMSTLLACTCAVDVNMCCATRTDYSYNETSGSYTTLPAILSAFASLLTGLSGITLTTSNSFIRTVISIYGESYERYEHYIEVETKDCTAYFVLQTSLVILTLASLPTVVGACILPPREPTFVPIFIPLPTTTAPPPVPVVNQLRALLFPAIRESVIPVQGVSFPSDGCDRDGVRFQNTCADLLHSPAVCPAPMWVVLMQTTGNPQAVCRPRLCGRGRVFLVSDQLCHDVREPGLCPGDRRLYLTAFGNPVCDCYPGEFPAPDGTCYPLNTQGPCSPSEVWTLGDPDGAPKCQKDPCPKKKGKIFVPFKYGGCVALGSTANCPPGKLIGYSISRRVAVCTTLKETGYEQRLESVQYLHQLYPRFPDRSFQQLLMQFDYTRRQDGAVTDPVFPNLVQALTPNPGTILDTPLLTQCRPGAARDANFKCRDVVLGPSVDVTDRTISSPPVPPLQTCPNNQCYNIAAMCVSCGQAVVSECGLTASLGLQQDACTLLAQGLG